MSKQNMEAFQVVEPEDKQNQEYKSPSYEGRWCDPRLITFCITNFVTSFGVSQIVPFYPDLASEQAGLNFTQIGLVFAINPLASIIFSLVIGTMLSTWGRKRCLVASLLSQFLIQILFGCLNFMTDNKGLFLFMSLFTRVLQGASRSVYSTVTFAYVPLFWPDLFQKRLAVMESMKALGLLFGPMIGSILNLMFGYSIPFFIIGTFFLAAIIPIVILLPSDSSLKVFQSKKKISIRKAFTSVKVVITMMNIMSISCGFIFCNPFFVNHMKSYGISTNMSAVIMTIPSVFYLVNLNLVPRIQKYCKKSFLMSFALVVCFVGIMLEAPFYGISDTIWPVIFGSMLVGFAQAFSSLPSIPQLIELLTPVINDPGLKNGLADMSAALFIIALGIGSLIGPLVGGAVYDNFGGNVDPKLFPEQEKQAFYYSLLVLGGIQLVMGVLFFFFGEGHKGWFDIFKRCSSKQDLQLNKQNLLTKKAIDNNRDNQSDGVMSDNDSDSQPDTDLSRESISPLLKKGRFRITREML